MPEKDGSEDKKSTKSVVNKKQKQFMNQEEQLDLSSVAESFGGQIVGEPVELDEGKLTLGKGIFTTGTKAIKFLKSKPGRKTFQQFVDLGRKYKGKVKTFFDKRKLDKIFKKSKGFDKIGGPDAYTQFPKPPIKEPFKPLKPLKDFIRTGTEKAKTQFQKIKDTFKTKKTKKDTSYDLSKDYNVSGNKKNKNKSNLKKVRDATVAGGVGTAIGTQLNKKKGGRGFRPGKMPGTAHNVGRRTNPQ